MTTAVTIAPPPILAFLDNNGRPCVGGSILTQVGGVNTAVYQDSAGTIPLQNPIPLNNRGEPANASGVSCQIFLATGVAYTFTLFDANGNQLNQATYVATSNISSALAAITGATLIGWQQLGAGSVARTVMDKGRDFVTSFDFGAKNDGVTDDTAAHQAGLVYAQSSGKEYRIMGGVSMVSGLTINNNASIRGEGSQSILRQLVVAATNTISITGSGTTVNIADLTFDGQQASQVALSTNDAIHATATGVSNGKPFYLNVTNCDFLNTPYRGVALYGANDNSKRTFARITGNRFRNGSTNAVNTTYSPIDVHLIDDVEAIVDDNDFTFDVAPTLPGGRSAVVVAETQTITAYYTTPTVTNNRINYRGVNELASLGAIDLYIWSGNAVVANNTIKNSTASAIKFKANSYDISVVDNKIDGQYSSGGALTTFSAITYSNPNYGSSSSQCLIDANEITNWNAGAGGVISIASYDGTLFAKNVVVTDNEMAAVTGIGIDINNCQDATVTGNEIDGRSTIIQGIRVLQCDGNIRIEKNKVANPTSYHIYNDTPLTATQDVVIDSNTLIGANATYAIYAHCRQAIVRKNFVSGGFHGVNFGGSVQSAVMESNILANMTGTVGFAITSTAVNVIARSNSILDSASISSAFADSSTPTFKIEEGNSWNGQVTWGTAAPAGGTWAVKDRRWNTTPNATAVAFWECTAAGTPGTWKAVALT